MTQTTEFYQLARRALDILNRYPPSMTADVAKCTIRLRRAKDDLITAICEVEKKGVGNG